MHMFILRRITSKGIENNLVLGQAYNLVKEVEGKIEFIRTLEVWRGDSSENDSQDGIYAFVIYDDGKCITPLYEKSSYFVMVSDGRTFANITKK